MGACGCGDFNVVFRLPPRRGDKSVTAIDIYDGCSDCGEGPGLLVMRLEPGSDFYRDAAAAPVGHCSLTTDGYAEYAMPLIRKETLLEAIREVLGVEAKTVNDDYDADGLLEDIDAHAVDILRAAIWKTRERWERS